jgi:hypothetical protein
MVFCTLEMCIFGLISGGQLMVRIRQIKSEKNHFFTLEIFGCKCKFSNLINKIFQDCKNCQFCGKSGIHSIYKVTSGRIEEIEEAPPPLEEDRGYLGQVCLL